MYRDLTKGSRTYNQLQVIVVAGALGGPITYKQTINIIHRTQVKSFFAKIGSI